MNMATVDSSIALGVRPVQIEDPLNKLAQLMQVQGMQRQGEAQEMQMQQTRQGIERQNKLRELLSGFTPEMTAEQQASTLTRGGYLPEAQTVTKTAAETSKANREARKAELETALKKIEIGGQILGSVKDPESYQRARQISAQYGFEALPEQYDPAWVAQTAQTGLSLKDRVEQEWRKTQDATTRRGQDLTNSRVREQTGLTRERLEFDKSKPVGLDGKPAKPMPSSALKMQNEALDMIGIASSIQADLGTIEQQIAQGKLDFGPVKNLASNAKNLVGLSDEQSRNFSTFKSSMEKLRNDSLRLNKGVQTDGDAQRAWNELFQNINDRNLVKQRLAEIKNINARAVELRKREVDDVRNNYVQPQYDFTTQTTVPSAITPPSSGSNIDALLEKYK